MRLLSLPFLFACSAWVTAQELNTFSNGEVANADKINENFQVLNSALDELTARTCPLDSVRLGAVCVDKYEASVWVTESGALIDAMKASSITSADQLEDADQLGDKTDNYDSVCPDSGNGCLTAYAVSVAGVYPSDTLTWFQAAATCRNSGKRLLTNAEWQVAALGTPDPGVDNGTSFCRVSGGGTGLTGSRSECISDIGAMDMVGNIWEWVADWWPAEYEEDGNGCTSGWSGFSDDYNCAAVNPSNAGPSALLRGGDAMTSGGGSSAGVFAIAATVPPQAEVSNIGFRCARDLQ